MNAPILPPDCNGGQPAFEIIEAIGQWAAKSPARRWLLALLVLAALLWWHVLSVLGWLS